MLNMAVLSLDSIGECIGLEKCIFLSQNQLEKCQFFIKFHWKSVIFHHSQSAKMYKGADVC